MGKEKATFSIDSQVLTDLKILAVQQRKSASSLVSAALKQFLEMERSTVSTEVTK